MVFQRSLATASINYEAAIGSSTVVLDLAPAPAFPQKVVRHVWLPLRRFIGFPPHDEVGDVDSTVRRARRCPSMASFRLIVMCVTGLN